MVNIDVRPERRFRVQEPSGDRVVTESAIFAEYWPYWRAQMEHIGKSHEATKARCLDEWTVINWAEEL